MTGKFKIPFTRVTIDRFLGLLISILLFFTLRPFLEGISEIRVIVDIFFSFILISGAYAASRKKRTFLIASILALTVILSRWSLHFVKIADLNMIGLIAAFLFFAYTAFVLLFHLLTEDEVTIDIIRGAICAYFLIGMMWACVYSVLEMLQPGSFELSQGSGAGIGHFIYYSFVTQTTLGYGDIVPLSGPARSLSLVEATIGQFYIAVIIARVLGSYISQSPRGDVSL